MNRKQWIALVEVTVGFFIIDCLNFLFFRHDPAFLNAKLHPYWLIVIASASAYGLIPGALAGSVAAIHVLVILFGGIPDKLAIEKMIESSGLILPVSFFLAGLLLGELRQKQIDDEQKMKDQIKENEIAIKKLRDSANAQEKMRVALEARIVGQTSTVKTLYETAKKFETDNVENVYRGCLEMISSHLQVEKASLYLIEGNYFTLKAAHGWNADEMVEGKLLKEETIMHLVLEQNRTLTVKDLLSIPESNSFVSQYGKTLALIPIRGEKKEPIGVVNIEKMNFISFNRVNLQLLEMIVDWTSEAIQKIKFYDFMRKQKIFDEKYNVYNFSYLETALQSEFDRAHQYHLPLSIAILKLDGFGFLGITAQRLYVSALITLLKKYLNNTETIFRYRYDGTFAVLSPMKNKKDISDRLKRLESDFRGIIDRQTDSHAATTQLVIAINERAENMMSCSELINTALETCRLGKL